MTFAATEEDQEKRSYLRGMFNIWRRTKAPESSSGSKPLPTGKKTPEDAGKYLSDLAEADLSQSQKDKYLALDAFAERFVKLLAINQLLRLVSIDAFYLPSGVL